ncbi:hypothetical protein HZS_7707 [Henneguya salminicola]|nr:hypothetical protein HZS_7707 [Henneguya salminicola]
MQGGTHTMKQKAEEAMLHLQSAQNTWQIPTLVKIRFAYDPITIQKSEGDSHTPSNAAAKSV